MSYLDNIRLIFSGDFHADVSTANNITKNYDSTEQVIDPLWNVYGSNAFHFFNCHVQSIQTDDADYDVTTDPVMGMFISDSTDRVSAKIVDLDPQFQQASQIWGMEITLRDETGKVWLSGQFEPAAFRDFWATRMQGVKPSDEAGSAIFQSVLTDLVWAEDLTQSVFLQKLKSVENDGCLSVRLVTLGYSRRDLTSERFLTGRLIGAVGPYYAEEPRSFVAGRRFVPFDISPATKSQIGFFDCKVDEDAKNVIVDLGNALPTTPKNHLANIGTLRFGLLTDENIQVADQVKLETSFTTLGDIIPYQETDWLHKTSGIWQTSYPDDLNEHIHKKPLALIKMDNDTTGTVLIRESANGWFIRADNFIHRVDPGRDVTTNIFVTQFGKPAINQEVEVTLKPPSDDPPINTPPDQITFPSACKTDVMGKAALVIQSPKPTDPTLLRGYIDGQIYQLKYQLKNQIPNQQYMFDLIVIRLYDHYLIPDQPTWSAHIQPIFEQYSKLYPVMSQRLFDLNDYDTVKKHREKIEMVMILDMKDANYMPVTRDLSQAKQETILKWLKQTDPQR